MMLMMVTKLFVEIIIIITIFTLLVCDFYHFIVDGVTTFSFWAGKYPEKIRMNIFLNL